MPSVVVSCRLYWDRDEPDASECLMCGDKCYLTMWRAIMVVGSNTKPWRSCLAMCDPCHQAAMEGDEE
jgi:hypothetical protein